MKPLARQKQACSHVVSFLNTQTCSTLYIRNTPDFEPSPLPLAPRRRCQQLLCLSNAYKNTRIASVYYHQLPLRLDSIQTKDFRKALLQIVLLPGLFAKMISSIQFLVVLLSACVGATTFAPASAAGSHKACTCQEASSQRPGKVRTTRDLANRAIDAIPTFVSAICSALTRVFHSFSLLLI